MKKVWGADEVGRIFVSGATDVAGKPSYFYCRICRKDVLVLKHGPLEVLRHLQGVKYFCRDQRLRMKTRGWGVLDFEGNPLSESELERQRERILQGPQVIRDREYPVAENLIVDDSRARMPHYKSLPRCRRWLKCCHWAAPASWFTDCGQSSRWLPAVWTLKWHGLAMRCWLVTLLFHVSTNPCALAYWCCVLVDQFQRDVPRILSRVLSWAKGHGQWSIEFDECGSEICVMVGELHVRCVCVAFLSRFSANTTLEATILGKILDAAGSEASAVSLHGCPHVLAEAFASCSGIGYLAKLVDYPTFDLRLMKHGLQRTAASVFGNLDPFSGIEFVVNRLMGTETQDRMASRHALRKAIFTNDLSIPGLVDMVENIVGVWPLVVSYLQETGRKDDGDNLVVRSSIVGVLFASFDCAHYCFAV